MTTPTSPDANSVIQDQNAGFKIWTIADIYGPPPAAGRYVPNVGDLVFDKTQGILTVDAVDETTLYSTLNPWTPPATSNNLTPDDILLAAGPGTVTERYRLFYKVDVLPYEIAIDSKCYMYGSGVVSYKLFRGADISTNGEIISQNYDQSGNLIGENIPMELVGTDTIDNRAIKAPMPGKTLAVLDDGEMVTAVFYDAQSGARSDARLVVKKSAFIRKSEASMKYITGIEIVSPYVTADEPTVLKFPMNMPVNAIPMMGVTHYSDGTSLTLPIDGTKFNLVGLRNFVATSEGQEAPLVLIYTPSANESSYGNEIAANDAITVQYTARTLAMQGAYSVKLVAFPRWVNQSIGYQMEYYLHTLDRDIIYRVTPYVVANINAAPFQPDAYNLAQTISVALQLSDVDPVKFAPFRFTTTFGVNLLQQGSATTGDLWTMQEIPNQAPPYGQNLRALVGRVEAGSYTLDLTAGAQTLEEWLNRTYLATQPLINQQTETVAPTPNYFAIVLSDGTRFEQPVLQWDALFQLATAQVAGDLVTLEFFQRSPSGDVQVGVAGMAIQLIN